MTAVRRWRLSYLADGALLVGLCLLFFWRDLTPVAADHRSFALGDFAYQFFAFARYESARLASGSLPLWNPYTFAGHPFLADIQSAIFYPFSLLAILLSGPAGLSYTALELEAILHFPLVAVTTYLLARRLTGSRAGGFIAAVAFTFSGYLTSYPPLQLAILEAQAWLPLILLCLHVAAAHARGDEWAAARRWAVGAGLLLGVSLLAGHPQSSLFVIYGSLGFVVFLLWPPRWTWRAPLVASWRIWRPRLSIPALYLLFGAGLAAVQLLPSLEFMRLSSRSTIGFDMAGSGFTPYDLLQVILPAVGVPVPALYVGIPTLGLAALALARSRGTASPMPIATRSLITFLGWSALLSLLLAFGRTVALYAPFYLLAPGWGLFQHQERAIVWAVLAVPLLAGYGATWLTTMRSGEPRLAKAYYMAALAAVGLSLAFFVGYQTGSQGLWGFTAATLFLALLAALSGLAVSGAGGAHGAVFLVALLAFDLFTNTAGSHAGPAGWTNPFPAQPLLAAPLADQAADTADTAVSAPFRMANEGVLPPNYGDAYGLEEVGGASPLELSRYGDFVARLPKARQWALLNVKYVLTTRDAIDAPAELVASAPGSGDKTNRLFRLQNPGPRAWLAPQAAHAPTDANALWDRLAAADFDPARTVLLSDVPADYTDADQCNGQIAWDQRAPERLALRVSSAQPCILVLSELSYPGWHATLDGKTAPLLTADGILRAVALPAGDHQVTLTFLPVTLLAGAALSLVALCGGAAWLIWGRRARWL
jgi:hypothetical protein